MRFMFFVILIIYVLACKIFEKRKQALEEKLAIWIKKRETLSRYDHVSSRWNGV